ncbi:MAG: IS1595 family transposase [Chitinophagaceae bacterium]|nr:IS1595 family transposase [Chitinophagaceae bacterium]
MRQFKSLNEVVTFFSSEEKCQDMLEKMRFPDGKIVCPKCGVIGAYRMGDCKNYKCRDKKCGSRFSITVGTVMEGSKLPLSKWFTAIYLITAHKKGISSCQLARDLGIGQKAAWFMNHRIREMLREKAADPLSNVVEVDETYVGGKWANMSKKKRAKMVQEGKDNKTPVMGLVEREGRAKLTLIGENSFKDIIRLNVSENAFINTDEHLGYHGLNQEFADHAAINHSKGEFLRDGVHTNTIEGVFSLFKRMVFGIYHQISPKHLERYCDEMTYRYNSRKVKDADRFVYSLSHTEGRLRYDDLIARKEVKNG